jgi:hypothetical protein
MTALVTAFGAKGPLLPRTGVIVGGTWMLSEFLHEVSTLGAGDLVIAVPFVDQTSVELSTSWGAMSHSEINVTLVTGPGDAARAWSELQRYPWKSVLICQNRDLHAKVYSFTSQDGRALCLIGSHNLTKRGLQNNFEAGVLLVAGARSSSIQSTIHACAQQVTELAQRSRVFCDTTKWPATMNQ